MSKQMLVGVWITGSDCARLGVPPGDIDPSLRPPPPPRPDLPAAGTGERRLSPTDADLAAGRYGAQVTVTSEEHYQPAIIAAKPKGWDDDHSWPILVELAVVDCNPHSKHTTPCVEVRVGRQRVGFLTAAMTKRYSDVVAGACADGCQVTARADAFRGTKAGVELWRLKVSMAAALGSPQRQTRDDD